MSILLFKKRKKRDGAGRRFSMEKRISEKKIPKVLLLLIV
jgi:hypothetical protein